MASNNRRPRPRAAYQLAPQISRSSRWRTSSTIRRLMSSITCFEVRWAQEKWHFWPRSTVTV